MAGVGVMILYLIQLILACEIGKSSYGILRVKDAFEYGFNIIDRAIRNKSYFKVNPNRYPWFQNVFS